MSFRLKMEQTSKNRKSNIILALDLPFEEPRNRGNLLSKAEHILETVHHYICAVKLNRHLVLPLGTFNGIQKLVEKAHAMELLTIMDCKINDIGSTNQTIAEYYYAAGFDALIANPFVGWEEGLEPVFDVAHRLQRGVILLIYMSHKATWEGYGQTIWDAETAEKIPQYISFAKKTLKWNADGAVVGATYPKRIEEIKKILGNEIPIYSPGVGFQGGAVESALEAGARYLIVGRTITLAENPTETAKKIRDLANQHRSN